MCAKRKTKKKRKRRRYSKRKEVYEEKINARDQER